MQYRDIYQGVNSHFLKGENTSFLFTFRDIMSVNFNFKEFMLSFKIFSTVRREGYAFSHVFLFCIMQCVDIIERLYIYGKLSIQQFSFSTVDFSLPLFIDCTY